MSTPSLTSSGLSVYSLEDDNRGYWGKKSRSSTLCLILTILFVIFAVAVVATLAYKLTELSSSTRCTNFSSGGGHNIVAQINIQDGENKKHQETTNLLMESQEHLLFLLSELEETVKNVPSCPSYDQRSPATGRDFKGKRVARSLNNASFKIRNAEMPSYQPTTADFVLEPQQS